MESISMRKTKSRSLFSPQEDQLLLKLRSVYGDNWNAISQGLPGRNPRQCKDRYTTYLDPNKKHGLWTEAEDRLIIEKFQEIGSKWVTISKFLPNRTDTAVKNRFHTLKQRMGMEITHKPVTHPHPQTLVVPPDIKFFDIFDQNERNVNELWGEIDC